MGREERIYRSSIQPSYSESFGGPIPVGRLRRAQRLPIEVDQPVGFDVGVDVSYTTPSMTGAQGHRVGQYFLNVGMPPIEPPFEDVRSFCTPVLDGP